METPEEKKNTMENFKKFDLNEPHETTASGSVAASKPKTEGRWFKDWKKITEAVIPKGPMCRDCADQDGTCPNNDGLPCDPTDEVIERFKRLRQQLKEREEALKELLPIAESGKAYHTNAKAIIERARKTLSKEF